MLTRRVVAPVTGQVSMPNGQVSRKGGATPLPAPTTVNFTSAQFSPGFTGPVNTTSTPGKTYIRSQLTLWSGVITGTEAKLTLASDYGDQDAVQVAIDGGAFVTAPRVGGLFTLFTGQPHAARFVQWRIADGMGDAAFVASSGNVLAVTGRPPALQVLSNKLQVGANSALGKYSGATAANSAGFVPLLQAPKGETYGSNVGSVKIRGAFTRLVVTLNGNRKVGVSKNGAPPVFYSIADEAGAPVRAMVIPCDGSTSTYNVWDDGNFRNGGVFAVAGDSALLDIGATWQLFYGGDSVIYGSGPGATSGDVECMSVAATLGGIGSTGGRSGLTLEAAGAFFDTIFAARTFTAQDVAVIGGWGNNAVTGIGDTQKALLLALFNKYKAQGFKRIIQRGVLPSSDVSAKPIIDAANAAMKSVVTAMADPAVVWCDTDTWFPWRSEDVAHPIDLGYNPDLYTFALRDYPALIGA